MKTFLIIAVLLLPLSIFSQINEDWIDPYWDNYYKKTPSGIEEYYSAVDFIKVIELVNFIPVRQGYDLNMLKKGILLMPLKILKNMQIRGDLSSRSKKHDDYYIIYNLYYNDIDKKTWDKFAPYLLPIMELDGVINLKDALL